jgi:hypothetical protein
LVSYLAASNAFLALSIKLSAAFYARSLAFFSAAFFASSAAFLALSNKDLRVYPALSTRALAV